MPLSDAELIDFHRRLVETPSISGDEGPIADFVEQWMRGRGWRVERIDNSVVALPQAGAQAGAGDGPLLLLDTHLDTVPPATGWTADPHRVRLDGGRIIGLGANDAKASAAALTAAFAAFEDGTPAVGLGLVLALVEGEETRGVGTEKVLAWLDTHGLVPAAAVIGEPTELEIAVAQKGLLILKLLATGDACHAANAAALGARNAARDLARAIVALDDADLGPADPFLGESTLQPTIVRAGEVKNAIPAEAEATLDVRTVPGIGHDAIIANIEQCIRATDVTLEVVSKRLEPSATSTDEPLVRAAVAARTAARTFGSTTMSDMVFMKGWPAIKVGPGASARSHTADEFVFDHELIAGARFYTDLIREFARTASAERSIGR